MFPNNPYIIDTIVRRRQAELEREAAWNRLVRECDQDAKGMKAGWLRHRLLILFGVLSVLAWFLR